MKNTTRFILFSAVLFLSSFSFAETLNVKVLSVHDGDTMTILMPDGIEKQKVRLIGVDSPEVYYEGQNQGAWAFKAKQRLIELAPGGSFVQLDVVSRDKFGRILGRVISNGVDANKTMLAEGLAVMYFIDPSDKSILKDYMEAAFAAEKSQIGIYKEIYSGSLIAPYDFRLQVKHTYGRNYVANADLKEVYTVDSVVSIALSHRVFFSDLQVAKNYGYKLVTKKP